MTESNRVRFFKEIVEICRDKPFLCRWFFGDAGTRDKPTEISMICKRLQIVKLGAQGFTQSKIARACNCSIETVGNALRKASRQRDEMKHFADQNQYLIGKCEDWWFSSVSDEQKKELNYV